MKDKKTTFVIMLLFSTLIGSIGQLSFKLGVDSNAFPSIAIYVVAGIIAYGVATLIYLYILGRSNLSWAYGFVGFSYIFTTILAAFVLGEAVDPSRWIGVVLIAIGTALIGMS